MLLRKARIDEIDTIARLFADSFEDYPLYTDYFFEGKKNVSDRAYWFFKYDLLNSFGSIYVNDEYTVAVVYFKLGEGKDKKRIRQNEPLLPLQVVRHVGLKAVVRAHKYTKYGHGIADSIMRPNDEYFSLLCIEKNSRGKGYLSQVFEEFCSKDNIYLETHTERNKDIYLKKGFKLVKTEPFKYKETFTGYYMLKE